MPSTGKIKTTENTSAAEAKIKDIQLVCFELGNQKYGLEVSCVEEIIRPGKIYPGPAEPTCILGQIIWNDQKIPLVDLRIRLDYQGDMVPAEERFMILSCNERLIAAKVDSVTEVLRLSDKMIDKDYPDDMTSTTRACVKGIYNDDEKQIYILDCGRVFEI